MDANDIILLDEDFKNYFISGITLKNCRDFDSIAVDNKLLFHCVKYNILLNNSHFCISKGLSRLYIMTPAI